MVDAAGVGPLGVPNDLPKRSVAAVQLCSFSKSRSTGFSAVSPKKSTRLLCITCKLRRVFSKSSFCCSIASSAILSSISLNPISFERDGVASWDEPKSNNGGGFRHSGVGTGSSVAAGRDKITSLTLPRSNDDASPSDNNPDEGSMSLPLGASCDEPFACGTLDKGYCRPMTTGDLEPTSSPLGGNMPVPAIGGAADTGRCSRFWAAECGVSRSLTLVFIFASNHCSLRPVKMLYRRIELTPHLLRTFRRSIRYESLSRSVQSGVPR